MTKNHILRRYDSEIEEIERPKSDEVQSKSSRERFISTIKEIIIVVIRTILPFIMTSCASTKKD